MSVQTRARACGYSARRASRSPVTGADRGELTAQLFRDAAAAADEQTRRGILDRVTVLNMGVAQAVAARYRDRGEPMVDLEQAAYVGLTKATRGFDLSYGKDFLTYAVPTISGEVKRHFRDCGWTVRPPRRIQELQARISRCGADLVQRLGRSPLPTEMADELGVGLHDVIEALAADGCFSPTSLDTPVGEDKSTPMSDLLGSEDADLARSETHLALAPVIRDLSPRDRHIITLRFFHDWTQEQIARDIGVTQMQVSRLLARILSQMRSTLAA
ncbi:MAG: sigma-70 family RNA polymerase sigma factor [Nocardioidaceae bacterium]